MRPARRTSRLLIAETMVLRGEISVSVASSGAISRIAILAILQTIALPTELPRRTPILRGPRDGTSEQWCTEPGPAKSASATASRSTRPASRFSSQSRRSASGSPEGREFDRVLERESRGRRWSSTNEAGARAAGHCFLSVLATRPSTLDGRSRSAGRPTLEECSESASAGLREDGTSAVCGDRASMV
jgi:hypothetical protein